MTPGDSAEFWRLRDEVEAAWAKTHPYVHFYGNVTDVLD